MFSKSKSQRFKDRASCAPPVGSYNVNLPEAKKLTSFQKSERFRLQKDTVGDQPFHESSSMKSISANEKQISFFNARHSSSLKKSKSTISIKKSIQHLSDLDICRKSLEADVEFQESKISSLLERIRMLEKELKETKQHADEIETCNQQYLDLMGTIRSEKTSIENQYSLLSDQLDGFKKQLSSLEQGKLENQNVISTLKKDIEDANKLHEYNRECLEQENRKLTTQLTSAQQLNLDFKEQLQSIETSMTGNIQNLSDKYEELETTLDDVHKNYKNRLDRSNSLLEKTKEANHKNISELGNLEIKYTNLKTDFDIVVIEKEDLMKKIEKNDAETRNVMEKLEEMTKEKEELKQSLFSEINVLKNKLALSENDKLDIQEKLESRMTECSKLKSDLLESNSKNESNMIEILRLENIESSLTKHSEKLEIEVERVNHLLDEERKMNNEKIETLNKEKTESEERFNKLQGCIAKQLMETQIKLTNAETKLKNNDGGSLSDGLKQELDSWRKKYEELEEKVRPFMSELDRYEIERNALLNENQLTQQEMNRLSDKYAQLLGHQNNKQKIHHIQKLKEENFSLKKELMSLRAHQKVNKPNSSSSARSKRFDPSKAFQHSADKENESNNKPLATRNS